jgi:hypothetical protein
VQAWWWQGDVCNTAWLLLVLVLQLLCMVARTCRLSTSIYQLGYVIAESLQVQ